MNLDLTPATMDFLHAVREFIQANLPPEIKSKVDHCTQLGKQDYVRWQKILFKKGWSAPHWPRQYGGCEWDPLTRYLFEEELAVASCPRTASIARVARRLRMIGRSWPFFVSRKMNSGMSPMFRSSTHCSLNISERRTPVLTAKMHIRCKRSRMNGNSLACSIQVIG